ncbi:succinate dehydrogenase assembly factor 2, partial [Klebsiella pneumoniae]|uniref:succinate dehydrogenase assembly factor 2 n=1 Tax=Klebsiella pneumoniae TaxID=573 RepID=UPI0027392817
TVTNAVPVARSVETSKRPAMQDRLKRLKFRAWHRGTREADYMIGGFFDRYAATWSEDEIAWYEIVVEEDDVDIMAWALGTGRPPAHLDRPEMIAAMRRLDYIPRP